MDATPAVQAEDVTFSYNGNPVLEHVNVVIHQRDFVMIVGPNGGGKTTLLRLILGLLRPTRGHVRVFGQPPEQVRHRIGYMPQHAQVDPSFPVTVMDVTLMGRLRGRHFGPFRRQDKQAAREALRLVEIADLEDRPFSDLSGGQRQRTLIARALASEPDLLLLDEPTASLDMAIEQELYDLLKRLNERLTIVMVSHDLGFVSQVVKTVVCVKGQCAIHPTSELTGDKISAIYGDVRMVRHDQRCNREGRH